MGKRPQAKMSVEDRAKQFMPFAALKGYEEALAEKEKIVVNKFELTDELRDDLDLKLHTIKKNDIATIVYCNKGEYLKVTGMVSYLDFTSGIIKIVNTKINFRDLFSIEIEDNTI